MDQNTTLCLACSSSLPPLKAKTGAFKDIYITNCCHRPICPSCIASNPRLARYNPCLSCLDGVAVVGSGSKTSAQVQTPTFRNVDGGVHGQDTFILGDDDSDDEAGENLVHDDSSPPPYSGVTEEVDSQIDNVASDTGDKTIETKTPITTPAQGGISTPQKYYLSRRDTLQGVALRFGIDGRELCRLNNLPPSTLSTTPHLLHTRAFIVIPPSAKLQPSTQLTSAQEEEREAKRAKERAGKRLQTLTKEIDWRVAKAYVSIAEDPEELHGFSLKQKESGIKNHINPSGNMEGSSNLEAAAVSLYLEDEEWEQNERRQGRGVNIPQFKSANGKSDAAERKQWRKF